MLQFLCTHQLRQIYVIDVARAKSGLSPYGLDPVFVSYKPRPQDGVQGNQPSVDLMKYPFN